MRLIDADVLETKIRQSGKTQSWKDCNFMMELTKNMPTQKGYKEGVKDCINIIENCVWKDADMLVKMLKEQ